MGKSRKGPQLSSTSGWMTRLRARSSSCGSEGRANNTAQIPVARDQHRPSDLFLSEPSKGTRPDDTEDPHEEKWLKKAERDRQGRQASKQAVLPSRNVVETGSCAKRARQGTESSKQQAGRSKERAGDLAFKLAFGNWLPNLGRYVRMMSRAPVRMRLAFALITPARLPTAACTRGGPRPFPI
ncbi:hypothetical protein GQ53DRAFT_419865 [Thozetella sp. PMI_491]|nr:hypothetical protein GQ53DRAFT_419865 [Thozetella sp. PMI_491]